MYLNNDFAGGVFAVDVVEIGGGDDVSGDVVDDVVHLASSVEVGDFLAGDTGLFRIVDAEGEAELFEFEGAVVHAEFGGQIKVFV